MLKKPAGCVLAAVLLDRLFEHPSGLKVYAGA
jgi:hypothetical protein